jgi:hypothetical protein
MRFGLKDVGELPSMEEFEKLVAESFQSDLLPAESEPTDVTSDPGSSTAEVKDSELATVEKLHSGESDPAA